MEKPTYFEIHPPPSPHPLKRTPYCPPPKKHASLALLIVVTFCPCPAGLQKTTYQKETSDETE